MVVAGFRAPEFHHIGRQLHLLKQQIASNIPYSADEGISSNRKQRNRRVEIIPVIDLEGDFALPGADGEKKLREACEGLGCFRIVNHGVSLELMAEMKSLVADLLHLPDEIKRLNKDVVPGSGYMPPSPVNPHYEALGLFDVGSSRAVDEFCSQLLLSPVQRLLASF